MAILPANRLCRGQLAARTWTRKTATPTSIRRIAMPTSVNRTSIMAKAVTQDQVAVVNASRIVSDQPARDREATASSAIGLTHVDVSQNSRSWGTNGLDFVHMIGDSSSIRFKAQPLESKERFRVTAEWTTPANEP
jgi:hypothetical protein